MFKTVPIVAVLLSVLPLAAWPQEAQELQRVEVTGSRIKRIDTETPSPVQVITREQIERSGAQSVTEILTRAPAANVGSFDENAISSFTPGAGSASLRGLGPQATLVLINGRRVSPFGFASGGQTTFVDINQIPIDAVERIEVLLDGASAIYGSDAIGGVINVILRRNFNGLQASGSTELAPVCAVARDDERYERGMAAAGAAWTVLRLARLPRVDAGPDGDSWRLLPPDWLGPIPVRSRRRQLVAILEMCIASARRADAFGALAAWCERLADALRGRWPEAAEALPLYPAFH